MQSSGRSVQPESERPASAKRPIASIIIQPRDLRPFVLRRWSATVSSCSWALGDPSSCVRYWRARSKEKLMAKAFRELRRSVKDPAVVIYDQTEPAMEQFDLGAAAAVGSGHQVEVIASGAGGG